MTTSAILRDIIGRGPRCFLFGHAWEVWLDKPKTPAWEAHLSCERCGYRFPEHRPDSVAALLKREVRCCDRSVMVSVGTTGLLALLTAYTAFVGPSLALLVPALIPAWMVYVLVECWLQRRAELGEY